MLMRAKLRLKMFFCVYVDQNAKTLLIKNLPDKVIQHELKEVFEDGFQIRLVSKDGMSKRYVLYLELEKNMCLLDLNKQNSLYSPKSLMPDFREGKSSYPTFLLAGTKSQRKHHKRTAKHFLKNCSGIVEK